jgi:hypothetical protein
VVVGGGVGEVVRVMRGALEVSLSVVTGGSDDVVIGGLEDVVIGGSEDVLIGGLDDVVGGSDEVTTSDVGVGVDDGSVFEVTVR